MFYIGGKYMNKKSGVTMTVLAISIAIMLIIMTTSVIIGSGNVNDAKFDNFNTMLQSVADNVNAYMLKEGKMPITNQSIIYTNYSKDFALEIEAKGDKNNKLYVVDVTMLENYTLQEGRGSLQNSDVFLIAENTNNIYYLKGFNYKNVKRYGL